MYKSVENEKWFIFLELCKQILSQLTKYTNLHLFWSKLLMMKTSQNQILEFLS